MVRANVGYVPEGTWGYGWMRAGRLIEHHAAFYTAGTINMRRSSYPGSTCA